MSPVRAGPVSNSSNATESSSSQRRLVSLPSRVPGIAPVKLPRLYAITGEARSCPDWWGRFESMLAAGCSLVQLRCKYDGPRDLETRARRVSDMCQAAGATLLLNGPVELVRRLDLAGVHLPSAYLMTLEERPVSARRLVGASCHAAAELEQAQHIGADFACLSPVLTTRSHPGADTLGLDGFARLVSGCDIPVFALGGLGPTDLGRVREAGGYGVAGISAFWR